MNAEESLVNEDAAKIDVTAIMVEIRKRVEEKQRQNFYPDVPMNRPGVTRGGNGGTDLGQLHSIAGLRIEGEPITSHRPVAGSFIKSVKKLTRFWVRRYTDPLFLQQSYFNSESVRALEEMKKEIEELKAEVARLKNRN